MARYVIVNTGVVTNVVRWDGVTRYNPGPGNSLVQSDTANIGDTYDGVNFTPVVAVIPKITLISKNSAIQALTVRLGADVGALLGLACGTAVNATVGQLPGDPPNGT